MARAKAVTEQSGPHRGLSAVAAVDTCTTACIDRTLRVKNLQLTLLLAFGLLAPACVRAESVWTTDYKKAQEQAKASHKLLLLDFTGSDWCSWCKRLQREVFVTKEFGDFAKDNLILVEIDFPSHKQQSESLKKTNRVLFLDEDCPGGGTAYMMQEVLERPVQADGRVGRREPGEVRVGAVLRSQAGAGGLDPLPGLENSRQTDVPSADQQAHRVRDRAVAACAARPCARPPDRSRSRWPRPDPPRGCSASRPDRGRGGSTRPAAARRRR